MVIVSTSFARGVDYFSIRQVKHSKLSWIEADDEHTSDHKHRVWTTSEGPPLWTCLPKRKAHPKECHHASRTFEIAAALWVNLFFLFF